MSGTMSSQGGLTRRGFLKTTGAVAGAAAGVGMCASLTGLASVPAHANQAFSGDEQYFLGECRGNCGSGCHIKCTVRDGQIVKTEMEPFPDPAYNRICLRGLSHTNRIYGQDRLRYPMKRVGERGSGEWERISWDQAIAEITDTWKKIQEEHGKDSIMWAMNQGQNGSLGRGAMKRLFNLMGASKSLICIDSAALIGTSNVFGIDTNYAGNEFKDMLNADVILCWAMNMLEGGFHQWKFVAEAQRSGTKLIVVDANISTTAPKADYFLHVKPGTDAMLAMGLINYMIEQGYTDKEFLQKATVGPLLVKKTDGTFLRQADMGEEGTGLLVWDKASDSLVLADKAQDPALEGTFEASGFELTPAFALLKERVKDYTLEYAAEFCGIPYDYLREVADLYGTTRNCFSLIGYGMDRWENGYPAAFGIATLGAVTGNAARSGANGGKSTGVGFCFDLMTALENPKGAKAGRVVPDLLVPDVIETGKYAGKDMPLKALYVWDSNPLGNFADRLTWIEALKKLDLIVVADINTSDTTRYADYVLPVCHWFEQLDVCAFSTPYVMLQEKATEPLWESKSDFQIARLLGEAMGFKEHFTMDEDEFARAGLESQPYFVSWDELKEKKILRYMPQHENGNFIHGFGGVFPTPTKRAEFYLEKPKPNINYGQEFDKDLYRMTFWKPPREAWEDSPLREKYPLSCFQEHNKYHVHTQWTYAAWMRELDPEPTIKMNPEDAAGRGIEEGDVVKAFNDRGYVVLKATLNPGLRRGVTNIPRGWHADQFIDGHYQNLISREHDPFCVNQSYFDLLIDVEKV